MAANLRREFVNLALYVSQPSPCPYLPGRDARIAFVDPMLPLRLQHVESLLELGFRRSGPVFYRTHCGTCQECIPTRLPVDAFQPSRNLARVWRRNRDLTVCARPCHYDPGHFDLYCRYLEARHSDGEMWPATSEQYHDFILCGGFNTHLVEARLGEELVCVAVTDCTPTALSAVYTFFEPELANRSLGTWSILWQIRHAQATGRDFLYLGFYVEGCRKMAYKTRFRPIECFDKEAWVRLNRDA